MSLATVTTIAETLTPRTTEAVRPQLPPIMILGPQNTLVEFKPADAEAPAGFSIGQISMCLQAIRRMSPQGDLSGEAARTYDYLQARRGEIFTVNRQEVFPPEAALERAVSLMALTSACIDDGFEYDMRLGMADTIMALRQMPPTN